MLALFVLPYWHWLIFCSGVSVMHQRIELYSDYHRSRLIRQLDLVLKEISTCVSYSLSASMLGAYAERVWKMHDSIGEGLT